MPKLTAKSPASMLLLQKFMSGEIKGDEDPKSVWQSEDVFMQHKLSNFRTHYNNLRCNPPKPEDEKHAVSLEPLITESDVKRRRIVTPPAVDTDSDSSISGSGNLGAELMLGDAFFKPLNLVGVWDEPGTKTKRVTVVLVLPSGVNKSDFSLRISEDGRVLILTVTWPEPLINLELLHKKWLSGSDGCTAPFTMFHPAVLSLEDALKNRRERATDNVISTAKIPLPFAVHTHIEGKSNLFFKESASKVVYVELKAMAESYGVSNDNDEFEEF